MKIIVADDEPLAREGLQTMLGVLADTEVVATARNGRELRQLALALEPDCCIVDIEMPGLNGLEACQAIRRARPDIAIVFSTAHAQFALEAFDIDAADYLLKPLRLPRLKLAIERVRLRNEARSAQLQLSTLCMEPPGSTPEARQRRTDFWVKGRDGLERVPAANVDIIRADGDYVTLTVGSSQRLARHTITELAAELDPNRFMRVHRSTIVQSDRVRGCRRNLQGALELTMTSGVALRVGPSFSAAVLDRFGTRTWRTRRT